MPMSFNSKPSVRRLTSGFLTFPAAIEVVGETFDTTDTAITVTGVPSGFFSPGDYIFAPSLGQFVRLTSFAGLTGTLDRPFASNLTGEDLYYVRQGETGCKSFCVGVKTGSVMVDGVLVDVDDPMISFNDFAGLAPVGVAYVSGSSLITIQQ